MSDSQPILDFVYENLDIGTEQLLLLEETAHIEMANLYQNEKRLEKFLESGSDSDNIDEILDSTNELALKSSNSADTATSLALYDEEDSPIKSKFQEYASFVKASAESDLASIMTVMGLFSSTITSSIRSITLALRQINPAAIMDLGNAAMESMATIIPTIASSAEMLAENLLKFSESVMEAGQKINEIREERIHTEEELREIAIENATVEREEV